MLQSRDGHAFLCLRYVACRALICFDLFQIFVPLKLLLIDIQIYINYSCFSTIEFCLYTCQTVGIYLVWMLHFLGGLDNNLLKIIYSEWTNSWMFSLLDFLQAFRNVM